MFYVKEKISNLSDIRVEITDENVYGICPVCGKEVEVSLTELFSDKETDLYSTQILCEQCSKNILRKEG